jgi:hypothetical protein
MSLWWSMIGMIQKGSSFDAVLFCTPITLRQKIY